MRKAPFIAATLTALAVICPHLRAQEKTNSESKTSPTTLKIQLVITENEGEKKLANLPYTFFVRAGETGPSSPWTKVRMGSRIPVATGSFQTSSNAGSSAAISPLVNTQFQYIDVGTNIDARALAVDEGRFDLTLDLERSWVAGDVALPGEKQSPSLADSNSGQFKEPIIRQFRMELTLSMRDGQTIQSTQATDPLSGRILTVTVTTTVVK